MGEQGEFHEDAFTLVDRFLGWCRAHAVYVVLDLRGAPGGQTGTNIDDSPNNYPELFTTPAHQDATVRLWRELARRYRDETIVAGYDLLNEPLPRDFQYKYPGELVALYRRLIAEIRTVDPDHMIILEGSNLDTPAAARRLAEVEVLLTGWGCPPLDERVLDGAPITGTALTTVAVAPPVAADTVTVTVDGTSPGRTYEGVGAVFSNGMTRRLAGLLCKRMLQHMGRSQGCLCPVPVGTVAGRIRLAGGDVAR